MILCTVEQLLGLGAHLGVQRKLWDSSSKVYTLCIRKGLVILNMRYTLENMKQMVALLVKVGQMGGSFIFVANEMFINFGVMAGFILNVGFYSGYPLGGLISNHKKVWPVIDLIKIRRKYLSTNVSHLKGLPEVALAISEQFNNIGLEASNVGVVSVGFADSTSSPNKFMYTLPGNSDSIFMGIFLLRAAFSGLRQGRLIQRLTFLPSKYQFKKNFSTYLELFKFVSIWFQFRRKKELLLDFMCNFNFTLNEIYLSTAGKFNFIFFILNKFILKASSASMDFLHFVNHANKKINTNFLLNNYFTFLFYKNIYSSFISLVSYDISVLYFVLRFKYSLCIYFYIEIFIQRFRHSFEKLMIELFLQLSNGFEDVIELNEYSFISIVMVYIRDIVIDFFYSFYKAVVVNVYMENFDFFSIFLAYSAAELYRVNVQKLLTNSLVHIDDLFKLFSDLESKSKIGTIYNTKRLIVL